VFRRVAPTGHTKHEWLRSFFTPDGRLTALAMHYSRDGLARGLWDVTADRAIHTLDVKYSPVSQNSGHAVSPDGDRIYLPPAFSTAFLILGTTKKPKPGHLYELPTGRLLAEISPQSDAEEMFGKVVGLGAGGTRALWFKFRTDLTGADTSPSGAVWAVRALPPGDEQLRVRNDSMSEDAHDFSADGRLLALGADRGQVELWDLEARALVFRWQPHGGKTVHHLAFTPDRDLVTVADGDDRLITLRLNEVQQRLAEMGLGW
jgi:WD40 repeat protein